MTTTFGWLATLDRARLALVLVFEGVPYYYTTSEDTAGIATAWASTEWSGGTLFGGLHVVGTIEQEIELFSPRIKPDTLTFHITDPDDAFAAYFMRHAASDWAQTHLTENLLAGATTATVKDTSAFPASGTAHCGNETMTYSGKTATTLTGLTRGVFSLNSNEDGDKFAPGHFGSVGTEQFPWITSARPRSHYNRGCQLWLHHYEAGAWSTKANARLLWSGRVKSIKDAGDRSFDIEARNILEMVEANTLLEEQFKADLAEGAYLDETLVAFEVREYSASTGTDSSVGTSLPSPGQLTYQDVIYWLNRQLLNLRVVAAIDYQWTVEFNSEMNRTVITADTGGTVPDALVQFSASTELLTLLGWSVGGTDYHFEANHGFLVQDITLSRFGAGTAYRAVSHGPPIVRAATPIFPGMEIHLTGADGTWLEQAYLPAIPGGQVLPSDTTGFLQVGDGLVYAGYYTPGSGTDGVFTITANLSGVLVAYGLNVSIPQIARADGVVDSRLVAKQVWIESSPTNQMLLRFLMSTGTTDYNAEFFDRYPSSMGAGIPYSLIDRASFLGTGSEQFTCILTEPVAISKLLESALATQGKYLIWRDGKLTLATPLAKPTTAHALTESNKAKTQDRIGIEYSPEGLINGVDIQYARGYDGKFRRTISARDLASQSDFGQRRTVKIEGWGIDESTVDAAIENVAAAALAYFSRPLTTITRTINQTLLQIVPTDAVTLTDTYMIDPSTGSRGVVALPGWVLGVRFNFSTMSGEVRVVFPIEQRIDRAVSWGPAARVDDTAASGGYVSATKVLTLYAHRYSTNDEDTDASRFVIGDKVRIRTLEGTPVTQSDTIAAVGTNNVTLTTGIGAWDAAKFWVLEYDTIGTPVATTQKTHAFIADDANNSTGAADNDAYLWGGAPGGEAATDDPDYTQAFIQPSGTLDDAGRPLTVADWAEAVASLNVLLGHKTRVCYVQQVFETAETHNATSHKLIYGPIWCPLLGSKRPLKWRVLMKPGLANTATATLVLDQYRVVGTSYTSITYDDSTETRSSVIASNSAAYAWSAETEHPDVWPVPGEDGAWLNLELSCSAAVVASVWALVVYEDAL